MKSTATEILEDYKKRLWPHLTPYLSTPNFPVQFKVNSKYDKDLSYHNEMTSNYPLRKGKYLRPALISITAQSMGANFSETTSTAVAMQFSQDWILIHDDIEDESEIRRGKPTLHKIYPEGQAINAGDALHAISWKALSEIHKTFDSDKAELITNEFYNIISRTIIGQTIEMKWIMENKTKMKDEDYFFVADGKSGYYTIAGPIRLGAIIAGASQKQLEYLTDFGLNLGRCFQLVDDILDLTSDFGGLKTRANDIYEGKRTIPLIHLLRSSSPKDRKKINLILQKKRPEKSEDEVNFILEKMHENQSIEYAKNLARKYRDESYSLFEKKLEFLSLDPHRKNLISIINFILERKY